ncbi:MAG: tetratricopeptide repeat protein, partial [Armatimonadota bacterium]|nr:tetratricopeptide repeat protein [Armatimonadota bacterium]
PQLEPARIGLADVLERQGRWSEATEHWEALVRMHPEDPEYRARLDANRRRAASVPLTLPQGGAKGAAAPFTGAEGFNAG